MTGGKNGSIRRKGAEPEDQDAINLAADWSDISQGLRKDLGHQLYSQWIKPIQLGGIDPETGTLDLFLPTEFSANWVNDRFADRLTLAWKIARSEIRKVRIQVHPGRRKLADISLGDGRRPANDGVDIGSMLAGTGTTIGDAGFTSSVGLDPSLTLAAFVTGETNILGFNAAQRMAAVETPQFSPLYLKAATGQGKTHLLHAIGHQYLATHPRARIFYCSAERFMVEFVQALKSNQTIEFTGPDSALVHYYWQTVTRGSPGADAPQMLAAGRGRDEVVRVDGEWLIANRDVTPDEG